MAREIIHLLIINYTGDVRKGRNAQSRTVREVDVELIFHFKRYSTLIDSYSIMYEQNKSFVAGVSPVFNVYTKTR